MRIVLPPNPRGRLRPDALVLIGIAACGLVAFLTWLAWKTVGAEQDVRDNAHRAVQVAEVRGRIAYLDEVLAMSARMASVSGDTRWSQRFEDTAPALDAALTQAADMAPPDSRATLAATMTEAHRDLLQMERRALTLVGEHHLDDARNLLNGAEFGYLQDVYAAGVEIFGQTLKDGADARAVRLNSRVWLQVLACGGATILLVMAFMAAQQRIRLRIAVNTDPLTQLLNRRQFYNRFAPVLGQPQLPGERSRALLLVGIDDFKGLNDGYGHAAADRLLQLVAARLRAAIPSESPPARVGGDEFALLIEAGAIASEDGPARDVMVKLAAPYRFDQGGEIVLGFSAGLVLVGEEGIDLGTAMRQAGTALRRAKADGRGRLRVFDHAMDAQARDRARLEGDLRRAIDRNEIVPFFQPLVDLKTGSIVGVEVLARWYHAERGWVSPALFIPLAEDLGVIGALMERLLRQACRDALFWDSDLTVAFNVSPLQLRDDSLPPLIRTVLGETGFPARRLEIEVTESALVQDLDLARSLLEELRDSGVKLALDDFGTGYSSLKHLRCLPFDKLKIDASFVGAMVDDPESSKIVAAVVGLGHSLGLSTVAEGVETSQVADLLRDLGCDIGQGWLYGRAVPAAELEALIADVAPPGLAA